MVEYVNSARIYHSYKPGGTVRLSKDLSLERENGMPKLHSKICRPLRIIIKAMDEAFTIHLSKAHEDKGKHDSLHSNLLTSDRKCTIHC